MTNTDLEIKNEIERALRNLGADNELTSTINSWKDTMVAKDILFFIRSWNDDFEHNQKMNTKTQLERPTVVDEKDIITIQPSPTADTRSCDWSKVSKEELCDSSVSHREDVRQGFAFFERMMVRQAELHDHDKLSNIDGFHADFKTGFEQTEWWDVHRKINRHHLLQEDGVPEDVNLVDIFDLIIDCTMAGMARSGEIYPITVSDEILKRAFENTCALLKEHIVVAK